MRENGNFIIPKIISIELQEIILSIQNGNQSAFKHLYNQYSGSIYGMILRIVKREAEAEEILQSTFLKIWTNIHVYDNTKATFFTWMSQIARNTAIDIVRLKSFQAQDITDTITDHEYLQGSTSQNGLDIAQLTQKLPEKYKILLDKMFLEGCTQQEISDDLDIPLGTVKTRLRDAIQILRTELKEERHLLYLFSIIG